jgi:fimbrial chaperone protein
MQTKSTHANKTATTGGIRLIMVAFSLLLLLVPAWASLRFYPVIATLVPAAGQNNMLFTIANSGDSDIAVRVRVTTREIDQSGDELREDASALFTIFPAQAILKPGESRSVSVTWRGGEVGSIEKAYRIIAEQLPVDFVDSPAGGSAMAVIIQFRYNASLYVSPRTTVPYMEATLERRSSGDYLVLRNTGSRHLIINNPSAVIRNTDGHEFKIPTAAFLPVEGRNILAGYSRAIPVTLPSTLMLANGYKIVFNSTRE